jgi:hypothetical protein
MDIDDELPTAPAPAGGGEPSQALLSGDQFDVEVYAAQYSGRTRVARLLLIAGKCESEQMRLDALRLAYEGSLKGEDTALHRDGMYWYSPLLIAAADDGFLASFPSVDCCCWRWIFGKLNMITVLPVI